MFAVCLFMSPQAVIWSGVLDIRSVGNLRAELDLLLDQDTDVLMDFSAVERIDTAVTQLLVSFQQALQARSHRLQMQSVSEHVRDDWRLLGLLDGIEADSHSATMVEDQLI